MPPVLRAVGIRLLYGIPVIVLVTLGAAALANFMPGSPAQAILGNSATQAQIDALNKQYGFDRPFLTRYSEWASHALHGNLGQTLVGNESVGSLVIRRLGVTAELTVLALVVALAVALPLAAIAALKQRGLVDRVMAGVSSALLSLPSFVTVIVLSLIFSVWLKVLPATGWVSPFQDVGSNLRYATLPVLSLALYEMAFFYRVFRAELLGTLREDFILVPRARGLTRRYILLRHAFRPSMSSFVTVVGLSLGRLLGGAVIVETFFSIPGLGAEAVAAVSSKDLAVLQAIVGLAVVVYVVVFVLVDLAYAWLDPRVSVR